MYDYLIVGAGVAGCVLAERIATKLHKKVLIIDKRNHIAGNSYDFIDNAGVLVHKYGPHYFRTDNEKVFDYLSNFTEWNPHEYKVRVKIKDKLYSFPINLNTLEEFFGQKFDENKAKLFLENIRDKTIVTPTNAEEQVVSKIGWDLYCAFFKGYTEKQWGVNATELDPSVTARIPIRTNRDERYILGRIQAMPRGGYTKMFEKMLSNPNITIKLNTRYNKELMEKMAKKIIWTGRIDEYFNFKFGVLPYRSLKFDFKSYFNTEYVQECEQINYPEINVPYTRIVEIKHATGQICPNTTIVTEYPSAYGEPYYPIPSQKNNVVYNMYLKESSNLKNIYFIGRLTQYKYLNIDEVVKNALELFEKISD